MGIEALLLSQVITISGSTGQVVTRQANGTLALQDAASAGISGSTGATDNAILRADGTGGATLQTSNLTIDDLFTASPNNVVNYVCAKVEGGTTNVGLALVPKGTGALSLQVPDGTAVGGNARGANAVDLQRVRGTAAQVASGEATFAAGTSNTVLSSNGVTGAAAFGNANTVDRRGFAAGANNVANGNATSMALGQNNNVTGGEGSCAFGNQNAVTASHGAVAMGFRNTVSARNALAFGADALAYMPGSLALAAGRFAAAGDAQHQRVMGRIVTTNATPTRILHYDTFESMNFVLPAGKVFAFTARICGIRSDGGAVAVFVRQGCIKRVVNTTSLVGSIQTIGTDIEDDASTDVAITADDTTEALNISVTGIASETWRWVAVVEGVEIAYGS